MLGEFQELLAKLRNLSPEILMSAALVFAVHRKYSSRLVGVLCLCTMSVFVANHVAVPLLKAQIESTENIVTLKEEITSLKKQNTILKQDYQHASDISEVFLYDGGNIAAYYSDVMKILRERSDKGYSEAQFWLGYILDPSHTNMKNAVKQNLSQAKAMYHRAALNGHMQAQFCLGNIYYREKNHDEALKFYRLAADQGHKEAEYSVGYLFGRGLVSGNIDASLYGEKFSEGFKNGLSRRKR